jgi:phosphomannomutase
MIEKVFKTYDVRGAYPNPLNEEAAWKIGHATAQFFKRSRQNVPLSERTKLENVLVVGRDMRPSSPELASALIDGIRSTGTDVIDVGMVDGGLVGFAINQLETVGGVHVTASHQPIGWNGMKISGPRARPVGSASGLDDVKRIASQLRVGHTGLRGKLETMDLWSSYRWHVLKFLDLKTKVKVAIDAGGGMAGVMVPRVFADQENLEIAPLMFEVDGSFGREPDPMLEGNLSALKELMERTPVDVGVCFDADADRCVFVDERGGTVGNDHLTAVLARDALGKSENAGATVVYDVRCSRVVKEEIEKAGGVARRERAGHSFMKSALASARGVLGGELTGHFYFRDAFNCDSGAIALACVLSLLSRAGKPMSKLIGEMRRYAQSGELNFAIDDRDARLREIAEMYKRSKVDYLDGITVDGGDWWFNLRKSNTEGLLRLNIESRDTKLLAEKLAELKRKLGEPV